MNILVEGFAPDALALARLLAAEGHALQFADLDHEGDVGTPDIAYLDVWTPEVAPRVARLRAAGARLSCLSDLLLERTTIPTIGVTGTAGKSTTCAFIVQLLRAAGVPVVASTNARSGNLWATDESLAALEAKDGAHVIELTSSHLAFMANSPQIAVVTSFWPDHLELHGSLAAYRAAKEKIVRHQRPGDRVVVGNDPEVAAFAELTPAERWTFADANAERGAFVRDGRVIVRTGAGEVEVGEAPTGIRVQAALAALAAVVASGVSPESLIGAVEQLLSPPFRTRRVGSHGTAALVDDSMSATPAKTAAVLRGSGPSSIVLVAGGALEAAGVPVHMSLEEEALLDQALAVIAGVARLVVVFGEAGARIAEGVMAHGGRVESVGTLDDAVARAVEVGAGAKAIVVSPMFPIAPEDRARVEGLLLGIAGEGRG